MEYTIDKEDIKFKALLEQKRHEEIKGSLNKLASAILESANEKDDNEIISAINSQGANIKDLVKIIKDISLSDLKVQFDGKILLPLMDEITNRIEKSNNSVIEALENRILPDSFELIRGYNGTTESVKVNYKQASKITTKIK